MMLKITSDWLTKSLKMKNFKSIEYKHHQMIVGILLDLYVCRRTSHPRELKVDWLRMRAVSPDRKHPGVFVTASSLI